MPGPVVGGRMVFINLDCAPGSVLSSGRVINHPFITPGRVTRAGVPFLLSQARQLEGKGPSSAGSGGSLLN